MFNLCFCNAETIRYSLLKFGHVHLCGIDYTHLSPHCCKCNSFGCITAIICSSACHGPHSDSVYSGSDHNQFDSPRLVRCEAGFPNPRGRWLAQTNYDALMTHHNSENRQGVRAEVSIVKISSKKINQRNSFKCSCDMGYARKCSHPGTQV